MSLDYEYGQVKNQERWGQNKNEADCTNEEMTEWYKMTYFAYLLMAIGVGEVSERNVKEIITRAKIFQDLIGCVVVINRKDYKYTADDIGYWTNASNKTRNQFMKKIGDMVADDVVVPTSKELMDA